MADFKDMARQVQSLLTNQFTCSKFIEQDRGKCQSAPRSGTFIMVDSEGVAYRVIIENLR